MIAIVNEGHLPGEDPYEGETNYSVRINHRILCHFTHKRSEGLTVCLEKATEAAREWEEEKGSA